MYDEDFYDDNWNEDDNPEEGDWYEDLLWGQRDYEETAQGFTAWMEPTAVEKALMVYYRIRHQLHFYPLRCWTGGYLYSIIYRLDNYHHRLWVQRMILWRGSGLYEAAILHLRDAVRRLADRIDPMPF
jgi:hypothetical protein